MSETNGLTSAEIDQVRRFCGYPAQEAMGVIYTPPAGLVDVTGRVDQLTLAPIPLLNAGLRGESDMLNTIIANLGTDRLNTIRTVFLPNLTVLETDIPNVRNNLDTDKADVWTRNRTEMTDRDNLLKNWSLRLCRYLGIDPGPGLSVPEPAFFVV